MAPMIEQISSAQAKILVRVTGFFTRSLRMGQIIFRAPNVIRGPRRFL